MQQSATYAHAMQRLGTEAHWQGDVLTLRRAFPGIGAVTYVPRATLTDLHGPTVINAPDRDSDATHRAAGHIPLMTPQTLALLDLRPDDAHRMAMQKGKWRNRLRRAQSSPLTLAQSRFDPVKHAWLLAHETQQRHTNRYTALPHAFTCAYPPAQTLLIQALHRKQPVAAMLFLLHSPGATYHIGWANAVGRRLNAHPLILWHASQALRTHGITQIDLGTIDTQTAPGLARFKLGSGAQAHRLGHTWLHLPRLSPLLATLRRWGGFPSGLLSKGSIGGPRTSQDTPYGFAQHRHHRPR